MTRSRSAAVRLMVFAAVAMALVALPAQAEPDTSRLQELEQELRDLERNIERREGRVEELDAQARELRDEAEVAQARIEEIEAELSLAVERYNEAVVALEDVQAEREVTAGELTDVVAEVGQLEESVIDHARRLHKMGPGVEVTSLIGGGDPSEIGYRSSTLRRILSNEQVGLEDLGAARVRLDALEQMLAEQEAAADEAAVAVEAEVIEVEATYERHADELAELTQIIEDVEQEQQTQQAQLADDRGDVAGQREAVTDERERVEAERQRLEQERREQERLEQERREQQQREQERREQQQREQEQQQPATATESSGGGSGGSSSTGSSNSSSTGSGGSGGGGEASAPRRSAQVAVDTALAQVGKPYKWGATGPGSFDCSGLTSYAWRAAGVSIPRTSGAQYSGLTKVSRSQLQPGDLVFYNSPISHVAMYIGGGQIVEASRAGVPVRTASLANRNPVGYARP